LVAYSFTEWINLKKAKVEFQLQEKTPVDASKMMEIHKSINEKDEEYQVLLNKKDDEIKMNNQQYLDGRTKLLEEHKKLNDELVKLTDTHEIQIKEEEKKRTDLDKMIKELQRENSKLTAVFTPLEEQMGNYKTEIEKRRASESKLKKENEELKNKIQVENTDINEDIIDAIFDEEEALEIMKFLGELSKNKYGLIDSPSENIENFFTENDLWESSIIAENKMRLTKEGRNLYLKVKEKILMKNINEIF